MKISVLFFATIFFASSCNTSPTKILISKTLLDSIKKISDTSYTKRYRTDDFTKSKYYLSKKDSTLYQLMLNKDSSVTQIFGVKKGIKFFEQSFYNNGQLIATLGFDTAGKKTGSSIYYNENGTIKRGGKYYNGFSIGEWKEYDETGKLIKVLKYDSTGVFIK